MSSKRLDRILFWLFGVLFFFTPLVWTPLNFELFEFNKMILVYALTALVAGAWTAKMVIEKRLIFKKTFLFFPLILFFLSQSLSTIFSIDVHTSIFGYYSRFHGGLLSTICYLTLFWALVSNGKKEWVNKLVNISLVGGVLVALYGVLEHFGIDKNLWVQDVQNRVFSTLGQPNWLAAYLNILLMIVLGRILNPKLFTIHYSLFTIFYLCLLYTKSKSGFLGFVFGSLFFWSLIFLFKKKIKTVFKPLFFTLTVFLTLGLLVGTPFSPSLTQIITGQPIKPGGERGLGVQGSDAPNITPSGEIRRIVWQGAIDLWKQNPTLGTGTESFAYSYYWVRSAEHNLTSEWDFLYNKAHNEYLNFLATTGTFGLISYLLIPLVFFFWLIKKIKIGQKKEKQVFLLISFASSLATVLITNFFGFSVVVIGLWFFVLPALSWLLLVKKEGVKKERLGLGSGQIWVLRGVGMATLWLLFQISQYWQADYYLNQGIKMEQAGRYETSQEYLQKAIKLRSNEAFYYDKLALTLAGLSLTNQAVEASNQALLLSPYQLNFYRDRAKMFFILSQINPSYLGQALETVLKAIELAPTDAKLYYNAGLMYGSLGEAEKGEYFLRKAVELKPNYNQAKQLLKDV